MKTKPILIITACILVVICVFFIVRARHSSKSKGGDLTQFLNDFDKKLKKGNADSLISLFQVEGGNKQLTPLLETLTGTSTMLDIKVNMDVKGAKVIFINSEQATVDMPVTFSLDSLNTKSSIISFIVHKINGQYKIVTVKANVFFTDYIAYQNFVRSKTLSDKDIFSPITLASFKTADSLKTKYDSVIWFAHIHQRTFYYVVKGKWDMPFYWTGLAKDTAKTYQMGLIGPDLKEIVPPQYDMIHNIGATFPGLVEVDKDHKHGFYDLRGKLIVPVEYDQIFPVNDGQNLAALRKGDDYYWLKNDTTLSAKVDLKISDILANLKQTGPNVYKNSEADDILEFNSREEHGSIYVPPSYLADLGILPAVKLFKNPLRKNVEYDDVSTSYHVKLDKNVSPDNNWFAATFYSIRDYFLGGRSEFYDTKNVVIVDKKNNRAYGYGVNTDLSEDDGSVDISSCNEYNVVALSDSLFELKISSIPGIELYNGDVLEDAPVYHYLALNNGKLTELKTNRVFAFTKFTKMNESYLNGCFLYLIKPAVGEKYANKPSDHLTPAVLEYMKNEIFADYKYKFKDTTWANTFKYRFDQDKSNASVDDSLTTIDRYNINWINQKLNALRSKKLAAN